MSGTAAAQPAWQEPSHGREAGTDELAATLASVAARMQDSVHPGLAGFLTGLWTEALRFDAADPGWPDRDRFVLSDGMLSGLLYGLLHLTGFGAMDESVLARFGRLGCAAAPRPMPALHPAVEAVAGSPAQGLATSVGLALGERAMAARFGRSLVDHRTWVLASATELAAGLGQEASSIAGALRLNRLAVVFEASGTGEAEEVELLRRFAACGWTVRAVNGGDGAEVSGCLQAVARSRKPTLIACHGTGRFEPARSAGDEAARDAWRRAGARGASARRAWLRRLLHHPARQEFEHALPGRLSNGWPRAVQAVRETPSAEGTWEATLRCLHALEPSGRPLIFLSSARASAAFGHVSAIGPDRYGARHLPCFGQEHGMVTLANGLALHGGLVPVCAAPAIAADRIRPALRLAALTGRKLVQLLTDDGLSSSAEGAAFQPVEQLAGLRAMPGLFVFRPGCAIEASECLELALRRSDGPSVILLSSVPCAPSRAQAGANNAVRGGFVVAEAQDGRRDATLIASGTELTLALAARVLLEAEGMRIAVVSLPCWELFDRQDAAYRSRVLGTARRFGIEAAHGFGWERWLGAGGQFIGLDGFGVSGGYEELRAHLGLTAEQVAGVVRGSAPRPAGGERPQTRMT